MRPLHLLGDPLSTMNMFKTYYCCTGSAENDLQYLYAHKSLLSFWGLEIARSPHTNYRSSLTHSPQRFVVLFGAH